MADPFRPDSRKSSTAAQFVPSGSFGTPMAKEWRTENAILNGYKASSWVYSCSTILANHVGSLPWKVWELTPAGDLRIIPGHDLEHLIEHPNEHQTRSFQMKTRTLHICLGGNALDKIVHVGPKRKPTPAELWTMRPDSLQPIPNRENWLSGWKVIGKSGLGDETLPPEIVCHSQIPDPQNPFWGMPPLRAIGTTVDMDIAQVAWNRELVENDAAPAGVFQDPNIRNDEDKKAIKAALKKALSGPLHSREPLVLSAGSQWHQLGISPRELDWIASRKFTVGEICTAYGFLTSRFIIDAATYNNLEAAIRYEWENGALPIAGVIGDGLGQKLLTLEERRRGMRIRPDTSGVPVLRENIHKASESYERFVRSGIPLQTAASIVDLPVGELPHGHRSFIGTTLDELGGEMTDEDM